MVSTDDCQHIITAHCWVPADLSDLTEHTNQWSVVHVFTAFAVDAPQHFQHIFIMNLPVA